MVEKHEDERIGSFEDEKAQKDDFREITTGDDEEERTPQALEFKNREAKLVKKLDVFIAPVMFLLMLISYLDRG